MTSLIDIFGMDTATWMDNPNRNCVIPREYDPKEFGAIADEWYPTERGEVRYAKRLCAGCPVQMQCFEWALDRPEEEGIWGGTTTAQRARLRAKRRAQQKRAGNDAA